MKCTGGMKIVGLVIMVGVLGSPAIAQQQPTIPECPPPEGCHPRCDPDCIPDEGMSYQLPAPERVIATLRQAGGNSYFGDGTPEERPWGNTSPGRWRLTAADPETWIVRAWDGPTLIAEIDIAYLATIPRTEWENDPQVRALVLYLEQNGEVGEKTKLDQIGPYVQTDWDCPPGTSIWWCVVGGPCGKQTARAMAWAAITLATGMTGLAGVPGAIVSVDRFQYHYCLSLNACRGGDRPCRSILD